MPILGSCQCKSVEYKVEMIDGPMWNCFCDTCRKSHAADHNTAAKVKSEHFSLTKGADNLTSYESSPGKLRWFCKTCGSHIYAQRPAQPEVLVVRAGTFDTDPASLPGWSVWSSHAKPWLAFDPERPVHREFP